MTLDNKKIKLHFQRFEFKYVFPKRLIEGILPALLKYMEFDPFARQLPEQSYTVASLYFDSSGYGAYQEKIAGLRSRKKLRIRYYGQRLEKDDPVFLEIKRKYDAVVVKDRLKLSQKECYDFINNNLKIALPSGHDRDTLEEFLWIREHNCMTPQVLVVYRRKPLVSRIDSSFRLTLDYDLFSHRAYWLNAYDEANLVLPDLAVLEVKFNNLLPLWFQRIIQNFGLQYQPFSKYCIGLEHSIPALQKENQWLLNQPNIRTTLNFDI